MILAIISLPQIIKQAVAAMRRRRIERTIERMILRFLDIFFFSFFGLVGLAGVVGCVIDAGDSVEAWSLPLSSSKLNT